MRDYRHLFSLPTDSHYLNCAYMAPMSRRVEQAVLMAVEKRRDPSTIGVEDFFDPADRIRENFAAIAGCGNPAYVAVIPSASYGFATIARNITVHADQKIVLLEEQFPSNHYTWRRLAKATGCRLEIIRRPKAAFDRIGQTWNEHILNAIDHSTALVSLPQIHWTDGTVFDLPAISDRTRDVNALLVVDGTQSVGAMPFDFRRIRPDALICAGYKWLMGSMGMSVGYFGEVFHSGVPIEENWITRANSRDFASIANYTDEFMPGAVRFDFGERGVGLMLPMFAEATAQVRDWNTSDIQEHCTEISRPVLFELQRRGFNIPQGGAAHLFGIRMPDGLNRDDVMPALIDRKISVSMRGNAVRVSPHLYNTAGDLEALMDAFTSVIPA